MSNVQAAIKIALDNMKILFPKAQKVLLEEVEIDEQDEQIWQITFSYIEPKMRPDIGGFKDVMSFKNDRTYKIFKVNVKEGKMVSMKIRELQYER